MQQEEISLQHYLEVLWRRKWTITAVFVIIWSLSLIGIALSKTKYKVQSLVAVKNQLYWRAPMLSFSQGTEDPDQTLSGEAYRDIINGLPFAEKVADHLLAEGMPISAGNVHASIRAEYEEPDRIFINAVSEKPEEATAMANMAAKVFVEDTKTSMMKKLVDGRESAKSFQEKGRREVEEIESTIAQFRSEMGFMDINGQMQGLREKIAGFEAARGDVITKLQIALSHQRDLMKLAKIGATGDLILDDPSLEEYRKLQQDLSSARIRYTDDHPIVRNLTGQIKGIEDRLRDTIARTGSNLTPEAFLTLKEDLSKTSADATDLQTAIDSWTNQIADVNHQLEAYPEKLAKLQSLEARRQAAQDSYKHWTQNLEELEFKKSMVPGNASLVDLAVAPHPSIGKFTLLLLATLISMMIAVGIGLLVEFADTTLRTPEEITGTIGLGYLGSIVKLKEPRVVVFQDGKVINQIAEAYTRVYSNIKFAEIESPFHSILITSARKGEGKSTTLTNLACAIAAAGKRVIIVDTDLRNPSLQRILGTKHTAGVTSVLAGEKTLDEVLQPTSHPGLTLLPSGPIPPNPAELLHSTAMKEVIRELEKRADLVVFDSPPTLLVADAMLLAGELDAAVIVAESGGVSRKAVHQVKESLQVAKARLLGVILNKMQESPGAYYNYYSYYKYYKEPEEEREPVAIGWIKSGLGIGKSRSGRS